MTSEVWQYQDFSLNIYKKKYGGFHLLGYNKNSPQYIGGDLYWSIGFLLKILGFTDLSNQTHYNKPISLNSKYEQRRKFLKEKMYKHNNRDQILDWYGVDDICCGQPLTNRDTYRIEQKNFNFYQQLTPQNIVLTMSHHNQSAPEITPVSNYFTANTFLKILFYNTIASRLMHTRGSQVIIGLPPN